MQVVELEEQGLRLSRPISIGHAGGKAELIGQSLGLHVDQSLIGLNGFVIGLSIETATGPAGKGLLGIGAQTECLLIETPLLVAHGLYTRAHDIIVVITPRWVNTVKDKGQLASTLTLIQKGCHLHGVLLETRQTEGGIGKEDIAGGIGKGIDELAADGE